jgi:protein-disulfide isomerase
MLGILMTNTLVRRCAGFFLTSVIAAGAGVFVSAQDTPDTVLRPPKGSQVAIVIFEDLQCPMCRRTAPLVEQASKTYKIPVVRHDFPLPIHNWSYQAAVMARYFDTHAKSLGNEFRDYIFENQLEINPQNLRSFAEKFAAAHQVGLPFVLDPSGKLAAQVEADKSLGQTIKIDHTPTVYIVSSNPNRPYVEVKDNNQLYATIDAVMKDMGSKSKADKPSTSTAKKPGGSTSKSKTAISSAQPPAQ